MKFIAQLQEKIRAQFIRKRLAKKQLVWILAFSSFVTLIGTAMQLFLEYRNDTDFIQQQFEQVKNAHLDSLTGSLWEFDEKQIEVQLNSILNLRDIVAVKIVESTGVEYLRGEEFLPYHTERAHFEMVFTGMGKHENIGILEITASFEGVYNRLKERIFVILLTQACKTFFVSLFILYVINHLVMQHLGTIAEYSTKMHIATLGKRLSLHRKENGPEASDELDTVVDALNSMSKRLQDDVVAQKKIEQSLRESEEKYREIFENAVEGFFQSTPDGKFLSVNPAFATMFGYESPEELLARVKDIETDFYYYPNDRKRYKQAIGETGVIENFEFQAKKKDGTPIWICNNTRCYFNGNGQVVRYEGAVTDIHQRKVAEEEKERLQKQLAKVQKMESIGNLAGGIAHDFNNILSAVMGYAELSLLSVEPGSIHESNLNAIRSAGKRARDLVKQILMFARQTDENLTPVSVKSIAEEAMSFIRSTIPTTVEIKQVLESEAKVLGTATQINQIFMNLCTNAAQAMEKDGGVLKVQVSDVTLTATSHPELSALPSGTYLSIVISDTGAGIGREIADRIFDPYFTTKGVGEGTGMGLAIVHGIVESYGGKILLDTAPGKGCTFSIFLPVCNGGAGSNADNKNSEGLPRGKERVLFVDDEAAIVKTGSRMLEYLGYTVTPQANSEIALQLFLATPDEYDLVVTDMNMPKITGDILTKRIKDVRPDIPVILCTGYSKRATDEQLTEAGVTVCLNKPVSLEMMARTVRDVLDRREYV